MNSASIHDSASVRFRRRKLGENLAKEEPLMSKILENSRDYIVVPSPKTAIPAAEAYAEFLKLEIRQAIEKREGKRGFINSPEIRKFIMDLEYIYHDDVCGKKALVVDDSLVRGDTSKRQVRGLREKGVKEVHFRFTEPPIRFPCFYGIDFPSHEELLVNKVDPDKKLSKAELEQRIKEEIGADSVSFQSLNGLDSALGSCAQGYCRACLTGEYPTPCGKIRAEETLNK